MALTVETSRQYAVGTSSDVLELIHQADTNITVFNRDISNLEGEVSDLLQHDLNIKASGDFQTIQNTLSEALKESLFGGVKADVLEQLEKFSNVSGAESFRLFLGTVNTNMCRKFHTDINDLRMLCTYSGPGTLWLKEDNVNREALGSSSSQEEDIVINQNDIQQAETGSIVILKGAIYPKAGTKAIVHRSPTIEESGERRLLLRIDTNSFLSY